LPVRLRGLRLASELGRAGPPAPFGETPALVARRSLPPAVVATMRPHQWIKNGLVVAAPGAAGAAVCPVFDQGKGNHEVDCGAVGMADRGGGVEGAAFGAAGVAVPGAVFEVDGAGWVAVAALVGVGPGEAANRCLCPCPAGDLDAERGVVAADVGAGECLGHRAALLISSRAGCACRGGRR